MSAVVVRAERERETERSPRAEEEEEQQQKLFFELFFNNAFFLPLHFETEER